MFSYYDGLVQDCSNSIANALELLQSCTKPSICCTLEPASVRCDRAFIEPMYCNKPSSAHWLHCGDYSTKGEFKPDSSGWRPTNQFYPFVVSSIGENFQNTEYLFDITLSLCELMAPTQYLNQCWLVISEVQWHSSECNFTRNTSAINLLNLLKKKKYSSKILFKWGANELISDRCQST